MSALAAWWYFRPGGYGSTPSREEYPIRGIDISAHNGDIDFHQLKADSIDFVLIKATEGTAFKDSRFQHNYRQAQRAGLRIGAYHFFRFDSPGYMQALNFLHSVRGKTFDMPLVVDIEEWTNPNDRTTERILIQLREFISNVEDAGYKVMLYSNRDGYERFLSDNFRQYPLWIASLRGAPDGPWNLWQYTHVGSVRGTSGNIDVNTFNGTRDEWDAWLQETSTQHPQ